MATRNDFGYVWSWRKWPCDEWGKPWRYKGKRCRVLTRGTMNSRLIEFEDGAKFVMSENGLRKATP